LNNLIEISTNRISCYKRVEPTTFFNKSSKQQNDEFNKIRECIIVNVRLIHNLPFDEKYIENWSYIFMITVQLLEDLSNSDNFSIVQKAGRKYNRIQIK
jgi:hypothetical protein